MSDELIHAVGKHLAEMGEAGRLQHPELADAYNAAVSKPKKHLELYADDVGDGEYAVRVVWAGEIVWRGIARGTIWLTVLRDVAEKVVRERRK